MHKNAHLPLLGLRIMCQIFSGINHSRVLNGELYAKGKSTRFVLLLERNLHETVCKQKQINNFYNLFCLDCIKVDKKYSKALN